MTLDKDDPDVREVLEALIDCVAKATPFGEDKDGFVVTYLHGTGAIHKAIALLDRHGIVVRPGHLVRHMTGADDER